MDTLPIDPSFRFNDRQAITSSEDDGIQGITEETVGAVAEAIAQFEDSDVTDTESMPVVGVGDLELLKIGYQSADAGAPVTGLGDALRSRSRSVRS